MIESLRYIKSDLYKLKHSAFFWLHIICPVCGAGLVLLYSAFATIGVENKVAAFFQILALAYPFVIIAIICNVIMTVVLIAVLIAWFSHYSGKRVAD